MSLLPSNVQRERGSLRPSLSDTSLAELDSLRNSTVIPPRNNSKILPSYSLKRPIEHKTPKHEGLFSTSSSLPKDVPEIKIKRGTATSVHNSPDDHGRGTPISRPWTNRRSQAFESIYMTPPEYPSFHGTLPRQRTPFTRFSRPKLSRNDTTSYFSHRNNSACILERQPAASATTRY